MAKPLCSRATTAKTTAATAVAPAATALVTAVVPVVLAVVPRVPTALRLMAATSLPSPLTPSAFARLLRLPKRKENKHVAT
jgi:hypothetical protein